MTSGPDTRVLLTALDCEWFLEQLRKKVELLVEKDELMALCALMQKLEKL